MPEQIDPRVQRRSVARRQPDQEISRQPRGRQRPQPQAQPQQRRRLDLSKFFDVHFTLGIMDEWARIPKADWQLFLNLVVLGRRDALIRQMHEERETGLIVRGTENLRYTIQAADRHRTMGVSRVISLDDMRRSSLQQSEG